MFQNDAMNKIHCGARRPRWAYRFQILYSGALALVLAGCAGGPKVGPNYKAPQISVSQEFENTAQPGVSTNAPMVDWWTNFNDPKLNDLIAVALVKNHDLRIALANLREARALRQATRFDLLPVPNVDASYQRTRLSQAAAPLVPGVGRTYDLFDAGFDATWELDIFGGVRRRLQARNAEVQAFEASLADTRISLISEVARNYFELRGAQNELDVARRNAENQAQTLQITDARLEGGRGTELDVARAKAQLNSTLAIIPPLESVVARSAHRLAVLTGRQPGELVSELTAPEPLPILPAMINIGNPGELLRRRADIRGAERNLAAATAQIGVAVADLFPRVTFNGNIGVEAATFAGLGRVGSDTWSFGPHITWAILDLGHVRARIKASDARAEGLLASYERTVLIALEEAENALVDFGREQARLNYLRESVRASELAAKLAHERFDNGAADFLTVLDAERALLLAQEQEARSESQTATSLVAVYKSLGGGWAGEL